MVDNAYFHPSQMLMSLYILGEVHVALVEAVVRALLKCKALLLTKINHILTGYRCSKSYETLKNVIYYGSLDIGQWLNNNNY